MDTAAIAAFARRLERRLAGELPGADAQLQLSPDPREGWDPGYVPDDAVPGAGLALLFPHDGRWWTVLTLRPHDLVNHGGQLSFPGGRVEAGETFVEAALREAHEEIALSPRDVRPLGTLSPLYIPVSRFALHPVVALAPSRPQLRPDPVEVARIFEVELDTLRDPARREQETRDWKGRPYRVPFVRIDDQKLWGATAMVVAELLAVIDSA